jgi:hypothetical protein
MLIRRHLGRGLRLPGMGVELGLKVLGQAPLEKRIEDDALQLLVRDVSGIVWVVHLFT